MTDTTTRNLRNVSANLRHLANLLEDDAELPAPVLLHVMVTPVHGYSDEKRMAAIDQMAAILGEVAGWEPPSGGGSYAYYQAELKQERSWTLSCHAYLSRPDPTEQLRIENEQLRAALGKIKKIATKHTKVDGCTCEDCDELVP